MHHDYNNAAVHTVHTVDDVLQRNTNNTQPSTTALPHAISNCRPTNNTNNANIRDLTSQSSTDNNHMMHDDNNTMRRNTTDHDNNIQVK
jgi:hypothetical protein